MTIEQAKSVIEAVEDNRVSLLPIKSLADPRYDDLMFVVNVKYLSSLPKAALRHAMAFYESGFIQTVPPGATKLDRDGLSHF